MANFTKKAIRDSFVKLLNEKPLNQITVRDIVDDCGVNRNTFYYYYQDLPQLIESIVEEDADRLIGKNPTPESLLDCFQSIIRFALENRKAVMHIYRSVNRDIYEKYQWRICRHVVTAYADSLLTGKTLKPEDRQLIIDYGMCVCFGFSMGWMESGMKDDILEKFRRLCWLKQGEAERMIARCEENS